MDIREFVDGDFKQYVNYDNDRSLPNLMDGFKTTQRKLVYAFVENIGYRQMVVDKAGMRAAEFSKYHHGATSMIGVLVNMNKDYPGTNNMPLFKKDGQFGTRMVHKASSERYISTSLGDTFKKLFSSDDNYILKEQYEDGDKIEPEFYLPKLPLLLINGSDGTGNGYACNVLMYEPNEIKQAVQEVLDTGLVQTKLTPYLNGYNGDISKNHVTGQVTFTGTIERKGSNTIIITELTPKMELSDYKEVLNHLIETKTGTKDDPLPPLIKDYDNESTEDGWRFIVDCPRSTLLLSDDDLYAKFNLIERKTENLTVWLPNGKLKKFDTVEDLIREWVQYRLEFYTARIADQIARYRLDLDWLSTKMAFIKHWNANSTLLVGFKKKELIENINKFVTQSADYIDRLLAIRVSNLTIDECDELQKEIDKIQKEVKALEATTNRKLMSKELKEIKL